MHSSDNACPTVRISFSNPGGMNTGARKSPPSPTSSSNARFAARSLWNSAISSASGGYTDASATGTLPWSNSGFHRSTGLGFPVTTDAGEERYELQLGHINPSRDDDGVEQRLTNLGYIWLPAEVTDAEARREVRRQALLSFQRKEGLNESGEADEATRRRLEEVHGS